jgi:putative endonuclease
VSAFLYIVRCRDGSFYVGMTRTSLEERIGAHNLGHYGGFTASRLPVELVFSQEFDRIADAIAAERQVKGWRRAKKEALIAGRLDLLPALARRARSHQGALAADRASPHREEPPPGGVSNGETRRSGAPQDEDE